MVDVSLPPLALSLVGVAAVWFGYTERTKGLRMLQWPSVRGVVSSGTVVREYDPTDRYGGITYSPVVSVNYLVHDKEYCGRRWGVVAYGTSWRGYAERVVARHPLGSEVMVYYDPENPSDSVVDRRNAVGAPTAVMACGLAMALGGPLWIWLTQR